LFNWTDTQEFCFPITIIVIVVLTIILTFLLKNKSERIKLIPLKFISLLLIIAEIVKLVRIYNSVGLIPSQYWPFQFCSMFLVWFFIASFFKGKIGKAGLATSFVCGVMAFICFMISPVSVIGNATDNLSLVWSNFDNLHTFFYHWLIVLFPILIVALKLYNPKFSDRKFVLIPFYIYATVSVIMANKYEQNYIMILRNTVIDWPNHIIIDAGYWAYLLFMYAFALLSILLVLAFFDFILKDSSTEKS
jgi:hypothetical protein